MNSLQNLHLFADYFQILIEDGGSHTTERDFLFTEQDLEDWVWVDPGLVIFFTARNMTVPVEFEITDHVPMDDFAPYDHVTEASIDIASGQVAIFGNGAYVDDAFSVPVTPGTYRARIYHRNLGSISADGLDGDDSYRVVLWSDTPIQPRVLKRWREPN